jgi:ubiquinone/menaquinone biosynthesis C-methylase UbiE
MIHGRFDTDAPALKQRIESHDKYGTQDVNAWIFRHLEVKPGQAILDLGCGTGKQSVPLAELVGAAGQVLAVDLAQKALDELAQTARQKCMEGRVRTLRAGFDELDQHLAEQQFDRVLACFSLYYASQPRDTFTAIRRALKPGGTFFFCGPSQENNAELNRFHNALRAVPPPVASRGAAFMERTGQDLARELFNRVDVFTFENPLRFDTPDALHSYWSSYNLYEPALDAAFTSAAARHIETHRVFETVKRVVGVKAML